MYFFNIGTPLGKIHVCYDDQGLQFLYFYEGGKARKGPPLRLEGEKKMWPSLFQALKDYFYGGREVDFQGFPLNLDRYTPFTREVFTFAQKHIPYGRVTSYGFLAKALERGKAARAAGRALASNPLPVIIPCHRIVRTDGLLGGYSQGRDIKRELLKIEKVKFNLVGRVNNEIFIRW
ncbi:MAG: methylated-DNA--[protein]-cysteine S-methyltransferase [Candidatus Syntrophonatronum acetioxidans]|uniref:methylated-DNA--[protein]-cysteine S-methyltransferase n=1 Tax=Candidatus Syntrophonatronum acetioxidans TaxID=1795816 RepID=A0A424YBC7_9FIRM|nr:MAG: methylated-DNA--[protein]-cysteine S-methyltransferase [Candidatus Syntrophonatronum acetioxidans]